MAEYVVGYDGSEGAEAALAVAAGLATTTGATLVAVFGAEPPSVRAGGAVGYQRDAIEALAEAALAEARAAMADSPVALETLVVERLPTDALVDTAVERGAELIVVGTRGERPLVGAIIGSTSYKLLHRSPVPVLVVPVTE